MLHDQNLYIYVSTLEKPSTIFTTNIIHNDLFQKYQRYLLWAASGCEAISSSLQCCLSLVAQITPRATCSLCNRSGVGCRASLGYALFAESVLDQSYMMDLGPMQIRPTDGPSVQDAPSRASLEQALNALYTPDWLCAPHAESGVGSTR